VKIIFEKEPDPTDTRVPFAAMIVASLKEVGAQLPQV
jgi:hypothetical protein